MHILLGEKEIRGWGEEEKEEEEAEERNCLFMLITSLIIKDCEVWTELIWVNLNKPVCVCIYITCTGHSNELSEESVIFIVLGYIKKRRQVMLAFYSGVILFALLGVSWVFSPPPLPSVCVWGLYLGAGGGDISELCAGVLVFSSFRWTSVVRFWLALAFNSGAWVGSGCSVVQQYEV